MRPPPSRYKVVERGRRLEVIDTRTGRPASPAPLSPSAMRGGRIGDPPRDLAGATAASGAGVDPALFVTRRWFDDKGPRTIRMNTANRARLLNLRWGIAIAAAMLVVLSYLFWPLAVMLVLALAFGPKLRAQLRAASTSWLDGLDQI